MRTLARVALAIALCAFTGFPAAAQNTDPEQEAPSADSRRVDRRRPRALMPLYVSAAALAALDVQTTLHAHSHGAEEANPLLAGLEEHPVQMSVLKATAFAVTTWSAEMMWRADHSRMAVVTMVIINAVAVAVVINNVSVIRTQEGIVASVPPPPAPKQGADGIEFRVEMRFGGGRLQFGAGSRR